MSKVMKYYQGAGGEYTLALCALCWRWLATGYKLKA
jgi:hypothetical protein